MTKFKILAINPGSTSTKIAVFENEEKAFQKNIKHSAKELAPFTTIASQYEFRKETILEELQTAGHDINSIDIIVGRGGLIHPVTSGIFEVNEAMKRDLFNPPMGEHASNLGGLIASDIADSIGGVKAYITDPVVVDEMCDIARVSGHPLFARASIFHALNQKAIARRYAKDLGRKYEEINLIVVHLGGGISVGAHEKGMVVDVNNALNGEGPFSPERSGDLPAWQLAQLCFSGRYNETEIKKMITGQGGFIAYLGTNDAQEIEKRCDEGDTEAQFYSNAMAYQVAKTIGSMSCVLKGQVDGILLTGGIAYNKQFCGFIENMTQFIGPVVSYPGEDEMLALAMNGLMVLRGEMVSKVYNK